MWLKFGFLVRNVSVGIVGPGIHWEAKFGHINSIALRRHLPYCQELK